MSGLVFLLVALALSVVGSVVLWLRHRTPSSITHGIDEFSREMRALAPDRSPPHHRRGRQGPAADR